MKAEVLGIEKFRFTLFREEVLILLAGLREAMEELEDWEFRTRTGFDRDEMSALQDSIVNAIGDRP